MIKRLLSKLPRKWLIWLQDKLIAVAGRTNAWTLRKDRQPGCYWQCTECGHMEALPSFCTLAHKDNFRTVMEVNGFLHRRESGCGSHECAALYFTDGDQAEMDRLFERFGRTTDYRKFMADRDAALADFNAEFERHGGKAP